MNLYRRIERVWELKDISPAEGFVLVNLAFRADEKSLTCYPSMQRIGSDTGMDRRNVHRTIKQLVKKELLEVVSSGKAKGRNAPNRYRLNFLEMPSQRRHSEGNECRHREPGMSSNPPVNVVTETHEPLNHKKTVHGASALAPDARAPRRSRAPDPGEPQDEKRCRQLREVADLLRLQPEANEPEHRFLDRVERVKAAWDKQHGLA